MGLCDIIAKNRKLKVVRGTLAAWLIIASVHPQCIFMEKQHRKKQEEAFHRSGLENTKLYLRRWHPDNQSESSSSSFIQIFSGKHLTHTFFFSWNKTIGPLTLAPPHSYRHGVPRSLALASSLSPTTWTWSVPRSRLIVSLWTSGSRVEGKIRCMLGVSSVVKMSFVIWTPATENYGRTSGSSTPAQWSLLTSPCIL